MPAPTGGGTSSGPVAPPGPSAVPGVDTPAPPGFVDLSDVDPTILMDIRYATAHNFTGRPVTGYLEPRCLLTRQAAQALHRAQVAARAQGFSLKVYDCYRPTRATQDFATWAGTGDQRMKREFYPDEPKGRVFADGYVAHRSNHSSGSTVDATLVPVPTPSQRPYRPGEPLVPCTAPMGVRFPDNSIDMGTGFDCFDPRSHTMDSRITGAPHANRLLLRRLMRDAGFTGIAGEWWHFEFPGPFTGRYFNFPVARAALS
ncbi:MAG: M15 family metallopeptidase [Micromonosporaceae bacterium]|nr:M15 family metallopeptidase [Micromonosporaceae bacterium]